MRISKYFVHLIFFGIFLTGGTQSSAQSLTGVEVNPALICAGEDVTVSFTVKNGNKLDKSFTTATDYTIDFGTGQGAKFISNGNPITFNSSTQPVSGNGSEAIITTTFTIPDNVISGVEYTFQVLSVNPAPNGNKAAESAMFEVVAKPAVPILSSNSPVCSRSTLNLNITNPDATLTYSWTGPNGFTSTLQDPSISNVTAAMSGDYTVVATNASGCVSPAVTQTVIVNSENLWTGAINSDWNNTGNWNCSRIPDVLENVSIPSTGITNFPVLSTGSAGQCLDMIIESAATLEVKNNIFKIAGNITNNGTFDTSLATIELNGNTPQSIPPGTFLNGLVKELIINNNSGASLNGTINITSSVLLTLGDLSSNGFLNLISDDVQTALVDGNGTGDILGNVNMQRYLDTAIGYKYFSSPFSDSTVGDFGPYVDLTSSFPLFYQYIEGRQYSGSDVSGWQSYTDAANTLGILHGYSVNLNSASPLTITLTGTVNNGDHQINLNNTNSTYTQGFHLVGNPYPSPIDWDHIDWTKTNIENAIYFFTASDAYTGIYSSYIDGISSDGKSSNIIPSMQGFFIHVTDPAGGTTSNTGVLGIKNSVRVKDYAQQFLKNSANQTNLIRLSAGFANEERSDAMVFYFDPFASALFEKDKDALKIMNTNKSVPSIYALSQDDKKLSIAAIADSESKISQRIPIGIRAEKAGTITISLKDLIIDEHLNVFLIDTFRKVAVDLTEGDYNFQTEIADYNSRFYISFLPVDFYNEEAYFDAPFSVMSSLKEVGIRMNLIPQETGTIRISTVNGKIIKVLEVKGNEEISISGIKSTGVYLITYSSKNHHYTRKLIVKE